MKIRMLVEKTGPRYDGRAWPPRGVEFIVPDEEGAALCAQGDAAPVADEPAAETPEDSLKAAEEKRAAPAAEPAAAPQKPALTDSKDAWVAYAASKGEPSPEALTKSQLIQKYSGG